MGNTKQYNTVSDGGVHVVLQLSEQIAQKEAEREEMERVRMELYLEEQEERARQQERVSTYTAGSWLPIFGSNSDMFQFLLNYFCPCSWVLSVRVITGRVITGIVITGIVITCASKYGVDMLEKVVNFDLM